MIGRKGFQERKEEGKKRCYGCAEREGERCYMTIEWEEGRKEGRKEGKQEEEACTAVTDRC